MISIRIVNVDYYLTKPIADMDLLYNSYRGFEIPLVPIIRIYGVTLSGQKACLHIHGVFPYFYIPYDQRLKDSVSVANSIDVTVNNAIGKRLANTQHVHNITTVSGIPMYGYYDCEYQFLKVFFYNPIMAKKAGELLLGGNINGILIQPHEAHVPYILQFFMDYNLQGMNLLHLAHFKFRRKPGESQVSSSASNTSVSDIITELNRGIDEDAEELVLALDPTTVWTKENIPESMYLDGVKLTSSCDIEIDVIASDILNQLQLTDGVDMNPGLSVLWEEETKRRENLGLNSIVELSSSPDRPIQRCFKTKSDKEYLLQLKHKLDDNRIPDKIARPPVGLKGQEVAFPIESQNQPLTPATNVDIHIEGELSRSFGLFDAPQASQISDFCKRSQEISFDQSDLDCIGLLAQLQEEAAETHMMLQGSQNNEIDDDSILRSQIPDLKPNNIEQDSSDDEIIAMTQTYWADDSFMFSQLDNSEITSGQRQNKNVSESEDEIFGPSDESDKDKKATDWNLNYFEETGSAEIKMEEIENTNKKLKEKDKCVTPKCHLNSEKLDIQDGSHVTHIASGQPQDKNVSISDDEIVECSDECHQSEKLFALDGHWDTSEEADSVELKRKEFGKQKEKLKEKEQYMLQKVDKGFALNVIRTNPQRLRTECNSYHACGSKNCNYIISNEFPTGKELSCRCQLIKNGIFGKVENRCVNSRSLDGCVDSSSSDDDYVSQKGAESLVVPGILSRSRLLVKKKLEDSSVEELLGTNHEISPLKKTPLKQSAFKSRKNESPYYSCHNREESTSPEISPCKHDLAQIKKRRGVIRNKRFDSIPLADNSLADESSKSAAGEGLNSNYEPVNENENLRRFCSLSQRNQLTETTDIKKSLKGPQKQFNFTKIDLLIKDKKCLRSPASSPEVLEMSLRRRQLKQSRENEMFDTTHLDCFPIVATRGNCEDRTKVITKALEERSLSPEISRHRTSKADMLNQRAGCTKKKEYRKKETSQKEKASQSFNAKKKHYELRSRGPFVSNAGKSKDFLQQNTAETQQKTEKEKLSSCSVILNDIKSELQRYNADKKHSVTIRADSKNSQGSGTRASQISSVIDTKDCDNKLNFFKSDDNVGKLNGPNLNQSLSSPSSQSNSTDSVILPSPDVESKVERHMKKITKGIQIETVIESDCKGMMLPCPDYSLSSVPNSSQENHMNEESRIGSSETTGLIAATGGAGYNTRSDIVKEFFGVDAEFLEDRKTFKMCSQQSVSESASIGLPCSQIAVIQASTTPSIPSVVDIHSDDFMFEEEMIEEVKEGIVHTNEAFLSPTSPQLSGGFIRDDPYSSPTFQPENIISSVSSVSQNLSDILGGFGTDRSDDIPLSLIPCGQQIVSFDGNYLLAQSSIRSFSNPSSQQEEEIEETSNDSSSSTIIETKAADFRVGDSRYIGLNIQKQILDTPSIHDCGNEEAQQKVTLQFSKPPYYADVKSTLKDFHLEGVTYTGPFWGNLEDSKIEPTREIAGKLLRVDSNAVDQLPIFTSKYNSVAKLREQYWLNFDSEKERDFILRSLTESETLLITPLTPPPAYEEVCSWLVNLKPITEGAAVSIKGSLTTTPENTPAALEKSCGEYRPTAVVFSPSVSQGSASLVSRRLKPDKAMSLDINILSRPSDSLKLFQLHESSNMPEVGLNETRESTPQTSRKRRLSWDFMFGKKSFPKRKRLTLQGKKSSTDMTLNSPIPPSASPLSPVLRRMLFRRTANFSQSQIRDPALQNSFGFKVKFQNLQDNKSGRQYSHLTTMALEIFVVTRMDLKPDPELDEVSGIFYSVFNDVPSSFQRPQRASGCILVSGSGSLHSIGIADKDLVASHASNELELMNMFVECVMEWNPDIVVGYEIEKLSWGYLLQRGKILGLELDKKISRLIEEPSKKPNVGNTAVQKERQELDWESYSGIQIQGRIVLNLWRLLKDEIPVQSYTYENMAFHILHQRVPCYLFKQLSDWWKSGSAKFRYYVIEYFVRRAKGSIELIEQLNLIGRTSELARLFGIQFYEVFSRGSQWRVESLMLRLAKAANMISVSPSIEQRARMKAPEFLPLILEPQSRFYVDPVLVLDFQSLYPSVIIAHNYCFSTCIGRLQSLGESDYVEFGCTYLKIKQQTLKKLLDEDMITFSPAGVGFVRPEVRKGILPRMLKDILETRLMVKQSMKLHKDDSVLQRVLDSRQLGLKLIANVTYGYTSANFSGRMPSVEVADSVVAKGRETLQRAISLVENTKKWGAKVVYGDTDSMFVQLPGKSREDAFRIGEEIAEAVTKDNPKPMKLKFEKVYHPCILQTKKRYVGYMFEKPEQKEPLYEAKGIETVRRDGCPATVKILEKSLRLLFETKNVSLVKSYVQRQFRKILSGSVQVQDFIFAKEYRGRRGYRPGAAVPALEIAKKQTIADPRAEPLSGQRVPYVIVYGSPGLPLIRLVKTPLEVLKDPSLRLNANYYISKAILPPLNRCFSLVGADPFNWYAVMQRPVYSGPYHVMESSTHGNEGRSGESSIASFFKSVHCVVCEGTSQTTICQSCRNQPDVCVTALNTRIKHLEKRYSDLLKICGNCSGDYEVGRECVSLDCPVMYKRKSFEIGLQDAKSFFYILENFY